MELELNDIKQFFYDRPWISRSEFARAAGVPESFFRKITDTDQSKHKGVRYTDRIKKLYTDKVLPLMLEKWNPDQRYTDKHLIKTMTSQKRTK